MARSIRTFVCYGAQTLELTDGDAVVAGRSASCDVVLDDDLASRQHCRIQLSGDQLFVEDLGSRNGILVNGLEVAGRQELHHGDQVTAGRSAITVLRQGREPRQRTSSSSSLAPPGDEDSDMITGAGNLVDLLDGSARRALEDDDLMVAERTTLNLIGLLRRAARGRKVRVEELTGATHLALDLAERTSDGMWLGQLLELYVAVKQTIPSAHGPRFVGLAEGLGSPDRAVSEYVALAEELGVDEPVARYCQDLA